MKGSQIASSLRKSCSEGIAAHRDDLIASEKIKDFVFMEDVHFTSPSAAAAIIVGGNANGWVLWKNSEGKILKHIKLL